MVTTIIGAVTEWPKVHDWKSCVLKGTEGSNPSRSADLSPTPNLLRDGPFLMVPDDAEAVNPARPGSEQR
jgi:hypothetical protein